MKTLSNFGILFFTLYIITSCSTPLKKENVSTNNVAKVSEYSKGKELMEQKCNICHSVPSKSHDEIIAPPMVAIKRRYSRIYNSEEEFTQAITNWVLNPNEDDAIMYGAVQQFKLMPKLSYTKEEITTIVNYIYNNELEQPSWFQKHSNAEHQNGMSRGNGFRNEKGQGRRKNKF